jgi:HD-GYP domain-containing protein (c-di-GMP phosphodiesterase class II)
MSNPKPKILFCGIGNTLTSTLSELCKFYEITTFENQDKFEDHMLDITESTYDVLLCGDSFTLAFANEFAQVLKQQCSSNPMFFFTTKKEEFNRTLLLKNGFTDALLWPSDKALLQEKLEEVAANLGAKKIAFKQIFTADLTSDHEIPFSTYVYLPLNQKHVHFSKKGQKIPAEKLEKLNKKEYGKVYIDKKEAQYFYNYTADNLKRNLNQLSETERKEQVQTSVRGLFSHLFDPTSQSSFDSGKEALADCQKIVSSYITSGKSNNWYAQLVKNLGGAMNAYDHAASVSSIAALIAIGVGHPKPEDLALAGFFHDIGRVDFDEAWLEKDFNTWPEDIKKEYAKHPLSGVNSLKEKKIILPGNVEKAILQHHERYDGKGFPKQIEGERIIEDAQILSFADQFAYIAIEKPGEQKLSPAEIFALIKKSNSIGLTLLNKIEKLIVNPN